MKQVLKTLSLLLLMLIPVSVAGVRAQSPGEQNAILKEINKALAEQNQVLAEQNQALAEQVDAYDKRVSALEESWAASQDGQGRTSSQTAVPLWVVLLLGGAVVVSLLSFIYIRACARRLRKRMDACGSELQRLQNDRQRIDRVREELERKISAKEHELRLEVSAMSVAITAVRDANEERRLQDDALDASDETVETADDEKPKITSDQCFAALSILFIRNEQRMIAVEGGVSITTANKWLDAWERNGWVEKVSRGKYMKTMKGKKIASNAAKL